MVEVSQIVDRLNEAPFLKDLRLLDFDEKNPTELLQILNEVIIVVDPKHVTPDPREESDELRIQRLMKFLQVLKFEVDNESADFFWKGLGYGDKAAVYPVLNWLLQRLPQLQKRAYLAHFLVPFNIPVDFMQDQALVDMLSVYRELQTEFKSVHKSVDALRKSDIQPKELRSEITQLDEEKKNLKEKISLIQRQSSTEPGFNDMLEVTSRLRLAQDEENKLNGRLLEQRRLLQQSQQRLLEQQDYLKRLRGSASSKSTDTVLENMRSQVEVASTNLASMNFQFRTLQKELSQLGQKASEPTMTQDDVIEKRAVIERLKKEVNSMRIEVDEVYLSKADSNLSMFRQQASLANKKLLEKEMAYSKLLEDWSKLVNQLQDAERAVQAFGFNNTQGQSGGNMSREEFKRYGTELREKTQIYKQRKVELSEIRAEGAVLGRTEQILKSRDDRLEELMQKLEAEKGVSGYRGLHANVVSKSEQTATLDISKADTLEQISALVVDITNQLKGRKEQLQPLIETLKKARIEAQLVETEHTQKKSAYEKVAVGLEVERWQLEQECDKLQIEAIEEESRFHSLSALTSIAEARLNTIEQEIKWQEGKGQLLPDFRSMKDLYEHKLKQQEGMANELRRQQRLIKETEGSCTVQRNMFQNLHSILHLKLQLKEKQLCEENLNKHDEDIGLSKMTRNQVGNYSGAQEANIMTLC